MPSLTVRTLKLACHDCYTCSCVHEFVQYSTLRLILFSHWFLFKIFSTMEHNVPFKSGCYFRLQKKWLNRHLLPASRYSYVTPFLDIHILHCFSTWITHSNKVEHQTKTEHLWGNRFWCLLQRTDYKKSGWKANSNTNHKCFWEHKEMPRCCWNYRFGLRPSHEQHRKQGDPMW